MPWLNLVTAQNSLPHAIEILKSDGIMHGIHIWFAHSVVLMLLLSYHTSLDASDLRSTLGQKWLGLATTTLDGEQIPILQALYRSFLKLAIIGCGSYCFWLVLVLVIWQCRTLSVIEVIGWGSVLGIPALLAALLVYLLERTQNFGKAQLIVETLWQRATGTKTFEKIKPESQTETVSKIGTGRS